MSKKSVAGNSACRTQMVKTMNVRQSLAPHFYHMFMNAHVNINRSVNFELIITVHQRRPCEAALPSILLDK